MGINIQLAVLLSVVQTTHSQVHFNGNEPFVWTKLGGLRGVYEMVEGKKVAAFLGVPFAVPPIGNLRFEKPKPINPWCDCAPRDSKLARSDCGENTVAKDDWKPSEDCVLDVNKPANSCMLTPDSYFPSFRGSEMWNPPNTSKISEDCLYLNIWVPNTQSRGLSVLVWIFGGGFFSGSPSLPLYNGKILAAEHDIIVVNINYRLGPFGFLYLGSDSAAQGNMGLLDQQLALKWIHDNIEQFGGDPTKVTLFGESAGSASVTAHLFASGSHQYFSKIICLSGSLTNLWATRSPEAVKRVSLEMAKNLSCMSTENPTLTLQCLKGKNASEIQEAGDNIFGQEAHIMSFPFVPINEDNEFFKGKISDHLKKRTFKKDVTAIFGTVNDEGTFWLPYYLSDNGFPFNNSFPSQDEKNQALIDEKQYEKSMEKFMPYFEGSAASKENLVSEYMGLFSSAQKKEEKLRNGVGRFLGDLFFTCDVAEFAEMFAAEAEAVYMYYFNQRSSANPWPQWMGVMHGYEIEYMFGQPLSEPSLYKTELLGTEQNFSRLIMKIWADFLKNGKPSRNWTPYSSFYRKALVLDERLLGSEEDKYIDVHEKQCKLIKEAKPTVPQQ